MAKRSRDSVKQHGKWIKDGRGFGLGSEYKPWLTIQDVPSIAPATRVLGVKTGRIHHMLSTLELNYFYLLDWSSSVTDIREQFPLLPLEETLEIASDIGVKHPSNPATKQPIVMTTDFVVNFENETVARSCKYEKDLFSKRVAQKNEIERRYWQRREINWQVVTEKTFSPSFVDNVKYIRKAYDLNWEQIGVNEKIFITAKQVLSNALQEPNVIPASVCLDTDELLGMPPGTSLLILRHMLARREIKVDMEKRINPREPITIINKIHE